MRFPALALLVAAPLVACSPAPGEPDAGAPRCPARCDDGFACDAAVGACTLTPERRASNGIAEVRTPGAALPVKLENVVVTSVVPSSDEYANAGFFVQAEQPGPGLYVEVNPDSLQPPPEPGDRVSFTVTLAHAGNDFVQAQALEGWEKVGDGADLDALTQDVSNRQNLIEARWEYDGEAVRVEGKLVQDWVPWAVNEYVAAIEAKGGFSSSKFLLRVPAPLTEPVGTASNCQVVVDRVGFRAASASSELWAFTSEPLHFTCPEANLERAIAVSNLEVRLHFDRPIDPSSVPQDGSAFEVSGGLTVKGALVDGADVTLLTSVQTPRAEYEVTLAKPIKDVLGGAAKVTSPTGRFVGYFPRAVLRIEEVDCGGREEHDLIELRALQPGSTANLSLDHDGEPAVATLIDLPDAEVEQGDLIVVHLNVSLLKGDSLQSETQSKTELDAASNHPEAWDFVSEGVSCSANAAVLRVRDLKGQTQDGVAFANSKKQKPEAFGPQWLRGLQKEDQWTPKTCGGQPCTNTSAPTAQSVVADSNGMGETDEGRRSLARQAGADYNSKSDWALSDPATFGEPNP